MGEAARGQSFPSDRSRPAEHAVVPAGLIGGVMDNRRPSGVVRWPVMTLGARGIPARGPAPPRTPALPLGLLADRRRRKRRLLIGPAESERRKRPVARHGRAGKVLRVRRRDGPRRAVH